MLGRNDLRWVTMGALAVVAALVAWSAVRVPSTRLANTPAPPRATGSASASPPATSSAGPAWRGQEIEPEITRVGGDDSFKLLVFEVPIAASRLRIADVGMTRDLERVLANTEGSLVFNAGFFDREERPEGLVVSGGAELSARSDALGGGIVLVTREAATLAAAEGFLAPPGAELAVQARPRLVVDGGSNLSRDDGKTAPRTALCLREQGHALEVIVARGDAPSAGPTLALLADMLVSRGCEGALNLDGGPSTGAAWRHGGSAHVLAPRGPVRHAIVVWIAPS